MSNQFYPTRSFIRFTAKSQLTADLAGHAVPVYIDRGGAIDSTLEFQPADSGTGAYCDVFEASGDCLDEMLLQRIVQAMFNPSQHPELYRPYPTAAAAAAVEAELAQTIVDVYKQACLEQRQSLVEQFNALLDR
ncbi:hypothetical protein [Nodosilinea nodulosa]|uniref:hypothetical protein n=1 Tax=Nodosilinea nodulosa TaxID=416001 RepID=UPI0002D29BA0|nr:hypothetical protein [Nodosilinea nodulosa]